MRELMIGRNLIRIWDDAQHLVTIFPDGCRVPASPQDDDAYVLRAADLGYTGDDATWQMCRDHECCHSWLAVTSGLPWSWTLFDCAHNSHHLNDDDTAAEEARVLAYQRDLDKAKPRPWEQAQHPAWRPR